MKHRDRKTPEEWQAMVDMAEGFIATDSARKYGSIRCWCWKRLRTMGEKNPEREEVPA